MFKLLSPLAIAGAILSLACLGAAPAQALSFVTFVSGKGHDTGTCGSPHFPCRTFQFAIDNTSAGGEVKALDPAHYGPMIITKSISITGIEGAGIDRNAGDAITINAGTNDKINLSHLTIDGLGLAKNGIVLNSGGSLTITHFVVRNFVVDGIGLLPTGKTNFLIGDTLVSDNSNFGIVVGGLGTGSTQGTLDHVLMNKNGIDGIRVSGFVTSGANDVTVVDSMATNNNGTGFQATDRGVLRLAHSAATGNVNGVAILPGATVESFGDNDIHGNSFTDVAGGTLTHVATQ